jgi:hypothetical protein
MKYAIITNGIVTNVANANEALESNWVQSDIAEMGDIYEDGQFTKPVPYVDPLAYQTQRAMEYPPITDYIDGIVKGDQTQVQTYIDACLAVKAKYPKAE